VIVINKVGYGNYAGVRRVYESIAAVAKPAGDGV
jgi:hypothetical protein